MSTECGIPWIELQGTEQDWVALRDRATRLGLLMLPSFGTRWMEALLPVLDEFVAAYRGNVNHEFWQCMVKRIERYGSGASDSVSGWINVLYPYLDENENRWAFSAWQRLDQSNGPDPHDFPQIISSAPVEWDYNGTLIKLHFHAGVLGTVQDPETLALRPRIGWAVTHDPPMEPAERIPLLVKEIAAIRAGGDDDYRTRYWIKRAEEELQCLREGKPVPKNNYW